jgi:hypothetical protein
LNSKFHSCLSQGLQQSSQCESLVTLMLKGVPSLVRSAFFCNHPACTSCTLSIILSFPICVALEIGFLLCHLVLTVERIAFSF